MTGLYNFVNIVAIRYLIKENIHKLKTLVKNCHENDGSGYYGESDQFHQSQKYFFFDYTSFNNFVDRVLPFFAVIIHRGWTKTDIFINLFHSRQIS